AAPWRARPRGSCGTARSRRQGPARRGRRGTCSGSWLSSSLVSAALRVGAAVRHELPQAVDERAAAGRVEAVDPLAAVPLPDEEARVGEDLQLVRDGGPREREALGELTDVQALAREGDQDVLAGLVAEGDQHPAQLGQRGRVGRLLPAHTFKHLNESTGGGQEGSMRSGRNSRWAESHAAAPRMDSSFFLLMKR